MARVVKKPLERKADIIMAARRLIQAKGFEKATLQSVMEHLGIAKGTIYHYFKSKEELLEAVVESIVNEHFEEMDSYIRRSKGTALEKMRMLIEKGYRVAAESLVDELHKKGNEALHLRLLAATLMRQAPLYAALIRQGCEEGIFSTAAPLESAEFILAGVQFLTDVGIYPWTKEELARRTQALPALIEQQLGASPGSFSFLLQS